MNAVDQGPSVGYLVSIAPHFLAVLKQSDAGLEQIIHDVKKTSQWERIVCYGIDSCRLKQVGERLRALSHASAEGLDSAQEAPCVWTWARRSLEPRGSEH